MRVETTAAHSRSRRCAGVSDNRSRTTIRLMFYKASSPKTRSRHTRPTVYGWTLATSRLFSAGQVFWDRQITRSWEVRNQKSIVTGIRWGGNRLVRDSGECLISHTLGPRRHPPQSCSLATTALLESYDSTNTTSDEARGSVNTSTMLVVSLVKRVSSSFTFRFECRTENGHRIGAQNKRVGGK